MLSCRILCEIWLNGVLCVSQTPKYPSRGAPTLVVGVRLGQTLESLHCLFFFACLCLLVCSSLCLLWVYVCLCVFVVCLYVCMCVCLFFDVCCLFVCCLFVCMSVCL